MSPEVTPEDKGDFLSIIGSYGPYQKRIFILLFLFNAFSEWQNFAIIFMAPNIDFRCVSTEYTDVWSAANHTGSAWTSLGNGTNWSHYDGTDQCYVTSRRNVSWVPIPETSNENTVVPCRKWVYDESFYQKTIISEWNLVCNREWLISLAKSIYMGGFLISVLVFGQLADCVGRYPTLMICYVTMVLSSSLAIFSQNYTMFVILRFFQACGRTGLTTTGYVLLMEIIGPEKRTLLGLLVLMGLSAGFVTLPILAWIVRPWVWLQVAVTIPLIPLVCVCCVVTESPRWLRTRGKISEFEKVLDKACKQNGRNPQFVMSELMSVDSKEKSEKENKTATILDLMRTPIMRKRILCMAYLWFVNVFVYFNLAYNTNDLGGNAHLNFFLSSAMEFPSYLSVYLAICKIGRRLSLIVAMIAGGASCVAIMVVPSGMTWPVITFAMIGRFFFNGTFALLYLYTAEMFPTAARNTAVGFCSASARIGSVLAPFTRELAISTHYTVPNGMNAALAVFSAVMVFFLPETKGQRIPDTLEEGENFAGQPTSHQPSGSKTDKSSC